MLHRVELNGKNPAEVEEDKKMSSVLMKSVSGIRGIVGDTLTPELILKVGSAFSKFIGKGTVVIGRDTRPTGEAIVNGIKSILLLTGCDVVDIGIVPTPTVQVMVEELEADGGIVISASHNPIEWNAFKLINKTGSFLNQKEINKFFSFMDEEPRLVKWDKTGKNDIKYNADDVHLNRILKIINKNKIKKSGFTVVIDSVNGAGSEITQKFLSELNCKIIPINCDMDKPFPRGAEPLPANLGDLSKYVLKYKADIGFAQDPDADRLAIVDDRGKPIGEEYTLVLVAEHLLGKEEGRVVTNLSTTKAVDDVCKKYGSKIKRTMVGEINVVDEMRKKETRIGGEGNGGVISPEVHLGRDSLVGIGYILEMMSERKKKISEIMEELPRYYMKKGKVQYDKDKFKPSSLNKIKNKYKNEKISELDGLRIDFRKDPDFKDGWVHLRASNTEPIFRIISEGKTKTQANNIYKHFAAFFKK